MRSSGYDYLLLNASAALAVFPDALAYAVFASALVPAFVMLRHRQILT
jgi:hypothetical protein